MKGNVIQTRKAIASVTIHGKGPYGISLYFIWKITIFLYIPSISIIISADTASYLLEILMIRYL